MSPSPVGVVPERSRVRRATRLRTEHDVPILRLAVPALGTLLAEPVYVLADTAIVARIGSEQVAGLGLASAVLLTWHGLMIFLAYGTTSRVGRRLGAGDDAAAASFARAALWTAVLLGLVGTAFAALIPETLVGVFGDGASAEARAAGVRYLSVSAAGIVPLLVSLVGGGLFHARQDARTPLVILGTGAVVNLVLEIVLVFGFGQGIGASALSTVVTQWFVAAWMLWGLRRWLGRALDGRPAIADLVDVVRSGGPLLVRTIAMRVAFGGTVWMVGRRGDVDLAAHQIATSVWMTMALALDAIAIAGMALTARLVGEGDGRRSTAAADRMIVLDLVVAVVLGALILLTADTLAGLFTDDPAVQALTAFLFLHVAAQMPANGVIFALDGILIGAGDLVMLGRLMVGAAAVFVPVAIVVTMTGAGIGWIWGALAVFMAARLVGMTWRYVSGGWVDDPPEVSTP